MTNSYYETGTARAERVRDLFGDIASRYDLINDLQSFGLHRLWKRKLVRLARTQPGMRALDVCCGTGDIALALREARAEVAALDFSRPMLRVAGGRAASSAPFFLCGDAQQLPFPDDTFDAVTVGYGLRNLANWQRGLEEMWRVARPGGRVLVLEFGKPSNFFWRAIYFAYLRSAVPIFGRVFCKNAPAYAYIFESLRSYPAQQGVAAHMEKLGCRDARIVNILGGAMSINVGTK
jgi:demethylmenaquinone methyltransferase / 2-methoxy-6-polyprenyl-1,4-benzoquinol methylase